MSHCNDPQTCHMPFCSCKPPVDTEPEDDGLNAARGLVVAILLTTAAAIIALATYHVFSLALR